MVIAWGIDYIEAGIARKQRPLRTQPNQLMNATLYLPDQPPQAVSTDGLSMPNPATGFARVPDEVPVLMRCSPDIVDVQVSLPDCVAYSVFDYEGPVNHAAMAALTELTGEAYDLEDEDAVLCGPVLVVRQ